MSTNNLSQFGANSMNPNFLKNSRGLTLIEILVASGIMMVLLFATMSMMINQFRETEIISQKLAVLDLEKFLILNSGANDICARYMTTNPNGFTFPTASFPPIAPVQISELYLSSASAQLLTKVGQSVTGAGNFKVEQINLTDFGGTASNYIATLNVSFAGALRPTKPLQVKLKLATTVVGADTIIIGCPGLNTGGSIPLSNFIPYTADGTFTVPPGVSVILVEAWGGGGGGGGSAFYLTNYAGGGGGGGGGGYGKTVISVVPGQVFNIVVGVGGEAGLGSGTVSGNFTATNGGNGGNSSFDGARLIAQGGTGGTRTITFPSVGQVGQPGSGGGSSGMGTIFSANGGNGGSASFNYINATMASGGTGGSAGGGGGGGGGALSAGSPPGGGGGGGSKFQDATEAYAGAPGARGQVNVWW